MYSCFFSAPRGARASLSIAILLLARTHPPELLDRMGKKAEREQHCSLIRGKQGGVDCILHTSIVVQQASRLVVGFIP